MNTEKEAMWDKIIEDKFGNGFDKVQKLAIRGAMREAVEQFAHTVQIKPLEWIECPHPLFYGITHEADTVFQSSYIIIENDNFYDLYFITGGKYEGFELEVAKQKAQEHYNSLISGALVVGESRLTDKQIDDVYSWSEMFSERICSAKTAMEAITNSLAQKENTQ